MIRFSQNLGSYKFQWVWNYQSWIDINIVALWGIHKYSHEEEYELNLEHHFYILGCCFRILLFYQSSKLKQLCHLLLE